MKKMDYFSEREPKVRSFPTSVALLLVIVGINVTATILSLLAAIQG
ncbi:hypothetical protein [Microvirga zambiensis]|nr:hypothetical protein [Microvirga zambiensis]